MIGHGLPGGGEPTVVTLSRPSTLTRAPLAVRRPNVVAVASMVVANVPPKLWVKVDPPLSARVCAFSSTKVPLLLVVVAPPTPSWDVGAPISTVPDAALVRL